MLLGVYARFSLSFIRKVCMGYVDYFETMIVTRSAGHRSGVPGVLRVGTLATIHTATLSLHVFVLIET